MFTDKKSFSASRQKTIVFIKHRDICSDLSDDKTAETKQFRVDIKNKANAWFDLDHPIRWIALKK